MALVAACFPLQGTADVNALGLEMPRQADALEPYRWNNRLLLVFAPSPEDALFLEQLAELEAERTGLVERDLLVLTDTDPERSSDLRYGLEIGGFHVLLVGKDGGVKIRSSTPVGTETLFATIDAMPMRQREIQNNPGAARRRSGDG